MLEENEITLTDRYDTDKGVPITERFVTRHKPTVWHSSVIVCGVKLRPKDKIAPKITVVDAPCHTSDKTEKVYCIDYTLPEGTDTFEAVIEFNKI